MNMTSSNIKEALNDIRIDSFPDEASRKEALTAARALVTRLETPFETLFHMSHEVPALNAALRFAIDRDIFKKLDIDASSPKNAEALSGDGDVVLTNRFLKHLAAMNIIKAAGANTYLPTRHSSSLIDPKFHASVDYYRDVTARAFVSLPNFISHIKFADPVTAGQNSWHYLLGRDESHFEWLSNNPVIMKNFGNLMAGYTAQRGSWLDIFPGQTLLSTSAAKGPVLVDVGGSIGQDLVKYLDRCPKAAGRLVLQDLPEVITNAKVPSSITVQGYDFFTSQPIQGARAYFLHSVLHDWPDDKCHEILKNLKSAMQPSYSRLLLNELVIPSDTPSAYGTSVDLTMLALFTSKERTEEDWTSLLAANGLKVVKIWRGAGAAESVIEAEIDQ